MRALIVFAMFGCGAAPRPQLARPSTDTQAQGSPLPLASASVSVPASQWPSSLVLETLPVPQTKVPTPKLEILEPGVGETLNASSYRRVAVRLRAENIPLTRDAEGVLISLDGRRPRRILADAPLLLGDLLREDEELEEGTHSLFAVAVDAEGRALRDAAPNGSRPFSLVDFYVGKKRTGFDAKAPRLFCLSPVGTHYVSADKKLLLDVLPVGFSPASAMLQIQSEKFQAASAFDPRSPKSISGLPFGDVVLSVTAEPGLLAQCVVTLNPAAPEDGTE